jgi:hypothetical protein
MREFDHGNRLGRAAVALVTLIASLGVAGPASAGAPRDLDALADCRGRPPIGRSTAPETPRLRVRDRMDATGTLTGYDVRSGGRRLARLGAGGFADGPFGTSAVVGERDGDGTRLSIVDLRRRCVARRITVDQLVYGSRLDPDGGLHLSLVDPADRRELGIWALDPSGSGRMRLEVAPPTGALAVARPRSAQILWRSGEPVGRWCSLATCEERHVDGHGVRIAVEPDTTGTESGMPLVDPRPVPEEPAMRWTRDLQLTFRWHGTETPPSWSRPAIHAAADDASTTDRSRAPSFVYDAGAPDAIRYTDTFPATSCATSIACASYVIGDSWTIRLRPHGKDFRWGTLRWCQADDRDGCFDIERVMIHEFGHIQGIDHPESGGFTLRPNDTVMHSLAPSKPKAGWALHRFGPCDTATLQERYDVPSPTTTISSCNDVGTTLALGASQTSLARGAKVSLVAELRIPDKDAYGRLGGNALSERSVQLRRRPVGGTSWTTYAMRFGDSPGTYLLSLSPSISYEFQAVFTAPGTEGLRSSTSPIVTVRVTDACTTTCVNDTEDPME